MVMLEILNTQLVCLQKLNEIQSLFQLSKPVTELSPIVESGVIDCAFDSIVDLPPFYKASKKDEF